MKTVKNVFWRLLLAPFLGGGIAAAALLIFIFLASGPAPESVDLKSVTSMIGVFGMISAYAATIVGVPTAIFVGIPLFLFGQRYRLNGFLSYAGYAFFMSVIFARILYDFFTEWNTEFFLVPITTGIMSSVLIFWFMARPDKPQV